MAEKARDLNKGDYAIFQPNSKGGIPGSQPEIHGTVIGYTAGQQDKTNVLVETRVGSFPVIKSVGGETIVTASVSD